MKLLPDFATGGVVEKTDPAFVGENYFCAMPISDEMTEALKKMQNDVIARLGISPNHFHFHTTVASIPDGWAPEGTLLRNALLAAARRHG